MAKSNKANSTPAALAVDVSKLHEGHPRVRAYDWRSPLVCRLLDRVKYSDGSASLSGSFRPQSGSEVQGQLPLSWQGLKSDFDQCIKTYQENVLTEFATLGLACILLSRHTDLSISEVCRRGERVDYWIGDSTVRKRFVLEVGGQQGGSIEGLSTSKAQQLKQNPWSRNGFICIAVYRASVARLWFCVHGSSS